MARLRYQGLELAPGETVLDGLQAEGVRVASSCKVGACQTCQSRPEEDLEIGERGVPSLDARVVEVQPLGEALVRIRLRSSEAMEFRPGQFVHLERADGLIRAYSLANLPGEDLELHVRVHPQGHMSRWLATVEPGQDLRVRGPSGECFYRPDRPEAPILLSGTGTGLAPLWGILRDALGHGHQGPITLVHGARDRNGLYYVQQLQELSTQFSQFRYVRCVWEGEPEAGVEVGDIAAVAPKVAGNLKGARVYLCGDPERVHALEKRCYLAGAAMKDILSDPFVVATPPVSI